MGEYIRVKEDTVSRDGGAEETEMEEVLAPDNLVTLSKLDQDTIVSLPLPPRVPVSTAHPPKSTSLHGTPAQVPSI